MVRKLYWRWRWRKRFTIFPDVSSDEESDSDIDSDDDEYEEYYEIPDGEVQALEMDEEAQRNMSDKVEKEFAKVHKIKFWTAGIVLFFI